MGVGCVYLCARTMDMGCLCLWVREWYTTLCVYAMYLHVLMYVYRRRVWGIYLCTYTGVYACSIHTCARVGLGYTHLCARMCGVCVCVHAGVYVSNTWVVIGCLHVYIHVYVCVCVRCDVCGVPFRVGEGRRGRKRHFEQDHADLRDTRPLVVALGVCLGPEFRHKTVDKTEGEAVPRTGVNVVPELVDPGRDGYG